MSIREKFHIPELFASYEDAKSLKTEAANLISWDLTPRQVCDLELLMNGGFYPLNGFMNKKDYDGVVENMRLVNGSLWPIPINLDVSISFAKDLNNGQKIALRDQEGVILAILEIADIYAPNKNKEAEFVYGTQLIVLLASVLVGLMSLLGLPCGGTQSRTASTRTLRRREMKTRQLAALKRSSLML